MVAVRRSVKHLFAEEMSMNTVAVDARPVFIVSREIALTGSSHFNRQR